MSVEIAWKQNILVTDFHLLKLLLVALGFGSQTFICGFSRQNICSVISSCRMLLELFIRSVSFSNNLIQLETKTTVCWPYIGNHLEFHFLEKYIHKKNCNFEQFCYTAGWNVCGDWFLAVNHHNHKIWVPSILTHNLWLIFTGMKQFFLTLNSNFVPHNLRYIYWKHNLKKIYLDSK